MKKIKEILWRDLNSAPPINYIWVKGDKAYKFNIGRHLWEEHPICR